MNSTSVTLVNNSIKPTVESWFIPLDILGIIFLGLTNILSIIFLLIIILDKTCHTVRMMLLGNICLTGFLCTSTHIAITVFKLQNDLKQIEYQDSLCIFRGYLSYALCALHCYSFLLSAIYQYMSIVYPTRLFWKSTRTQMLLIVLSWIWTFVYPIPFTVTGKIIYNVNNQVCQMPLQLSFFLIYEINCAFIIPVMMTVIISLKLVRYVKRMSKRVVPVNTLFRAQRDLKIFRRIFILIIIIFISGFPLILFVFLSFGNLAPKYHFRIGYIFLDASMLCVMIALFQFTDLLKASVKKLIYGRPNMVLPTLTFKQPTSQEKRIGKNTAQCQNGKSNGRQQCFS